MAKELVLMSTTAIAAKLADMSGEFEQLFNADDTQRQTKLMLYDHFLEVFGAEQMALWPRIGSDADKGDNNPDKTYEQRLNKDGASVKTAVFRHKEVFDLSVIGLGISREIEKLNDDKDTMDKDERASQLNYWNKRRNLGRSQVASIIKLNHMFSDFDEYLPGIKAKLLTIKDEEGDDVFSKSTSPVKVYENVAGGMSNVYSINSFLNFKPKDAADAGGEWKHLLATLERDTDRKGSNVSFKVKDEKTFEMSVAGQAEFVVGIDPKMDKKITANLGEEGSDGFILSLYRLSDYADKKLAIPAIKRRLDELLAAGTKVAKAS